MSTSECQLIKLANGDLMIVRRDESGEDSAANLLHRAAVSKDGGVTSGGLRRALQLITRLMQYDGSTLPALPACLARGRPKTAIENSAVNWGEMLT